MLGMPDLEVLFGRLLGSVTPKMLPCTGPAGPHPREAGTIMTWKPLNSSRPSRTTTSSTARISFSSRTATTRVRRGILRHDEGTHEDRGGEGHPADREEFPCGVLYSRHME